MLTKLLILLFAYLMGSIPSAIIVSKVMGLPDPRGLGSGNPGATNVLRTGSKLAAFLTLVGDSLKGFIPVLIASWFAFNSSIQALVAFSAFLGHLYPIFLKFKGGKGVATALGGLFGLSWMVGVTVTMIWIVVALLFRYSSLAAINLAIFAPLVTFLILGFGAAKIILLMSLFLIYKHKSNIVNLFQGTESRIGERLKY